MNINSLPGMLFGDLEIRRMNLLVCRLCKRKKEALACRYALETGRE